MRCHRLPCMAWIVSLALLAACTMPPRRGAPSWDGRRFDELKLRYMAALDDRPADETAVSVEMERELGEEVDGVVRANASGTLHSDDARAPASC